MTPPDEPAPPATESRGTRKRTAKRAGTTRIAASQAGPQPAAAPTSAGELRRRIAARRARGQPVDRLLERLATLTTAGADRDRATTEAPEASEAPDPSSVPTSAAPDRASARAPETPRPSTSAEIPAAVGAPQAVASPADTAATPCSPRAIDRIDAASIDPALPIAAHAEALVDALRRHPVIVVAGETGSGKTTQLPKLALAAGRGRSGRIGHTQPRRIAARSVARRIGEELEAASLAADIVGHKLRFEDHTDANTVVKLMTDGILLAECGADRNLAEYDTIIIDEAHERSLNIDFLLGLLKTLLTRRDDLRVVITSATIDAERLCAFFDDAPLITIAGRGHPVEIIYRPPAIERDEGDRDERGDDPLLRELLAAVGDCLGPRGIQGGGDVLVFLPGEAEIRDAHRALRAAFSERIEVLALYARLPASEQAKVFRTGGRQRVILATNVAETALTVPGIRTVIDTGNARVLRYSWRSRIERLTLEPISQAAATQRAGRCGRIGPGTCIRLYDEADFATRPAFTEPEILRSNLAHVVLAMRSMRLPEPADFPFLDAPESRLIRDAERLLVELGACNERGRLTPLGRQIARLPIDPRLATALAAGPTLITDAEVPARTLHEALLTIVAFLGVQDPRERPPQARAAADEAHAAWRDERSDFLAVLKLWDGWHAAREQRGTSAFTRWCRTQFLHPGRLREWAELRRQLARNLVRSAQKATSAPPSSSNATPASIAAAVPPASAKPIAERKTRENASDDAAAPDAALDRAVHCALLAGFASQVAQRESVAPTGKPVAKTATEPRRKRGPVTYLGPRNRKLRIHPASALARTPPAWIVASEITETRQVFARTAGRVLPEWILAAVPHLLAGEVLEPHFSARSGRVDARERLRLFGLIVHPGRRIDFARIDPQAARELFIREGLVEDQLRTREPAIVANREWLAARHDDEQRERRADLIPDAQTLFDHYDRALPASVVDGPSFEAWARRARKHQRSADRTPAIAEFTDAEPPRNLDPGNREPIAAEFAGYAALRLDQSVETTAPDPSPHHPESLVIGRLHLELGYRFEPGHPEDGVTLRIPISLLNAVPDWAGDWLVPALLEARTAALIKSLPKNLRRALVPAPDFARAALERITLDDHRDREPFLPLLARTLAALGNTRIEPGDFRLDQLESHLAMRFELIHSDEHVIEHGRDLALLKRRHTRDAAAHFKERTADALRREGITRWDFGTLPECVELEQNGARVDVAPILIDTGDAVTLDVEGHPQQAQRLLARGLARLIVLALGRGARDTARQLPGIDQSEIRLATLTLDADSGGARITGAASEPTAPQRRNGEAQGIESLRDQILLAAARDTFLGDPSDWPRDAGAFDARVERLRHRFTPAAFEIAQEIAPAIEIAHRLQTRLLGQLPLHWIEAARDIREQIAHLLAPGFVWNTPAEVRAALARYLEAAERRLERLDRDPEKDRRARVQVEPIWNEARRLLALHPHDPGVLAHRYRVEELRVSLFAPGVRVLGKVSPQRLDQEREALLRELARENPYAPL